MSVENHQCTALRLPASLLRLTMAIWSSRSGASAFIPAFVLIAASSASAQLSANAASAWQQPARDTPAQQRTTAPSPTGSIAGRVLGADNGRPGEARARDRERRAELPAARAALTDDSGVFELTELPAGRYTLTASKTGFIALSYGQRRPFQAGTPLQLRDGQQMGGIEFRLPRGSVVAGRVFDETGDPMPGVVVRLMRYQYSQGERQLVPAGTVQTDDLGGYRVWGLNPGDYYVSAARAAATSMSAAADPAPAGAGGRRRPRRPRRRRRAGPRRRPLRRGRQALIRRQDDPEGIRADLFPRRRIGQRGQGDHDRRQPGSARHQLHPAARPHVARQRAR